MKTKTVSSYTHRDKDEPTQVPDVKPGSYYVSVRDGDQVGLLLGPFIDDHAKALEMVGPVRVMAQKLNSRAAFYSFGTLRMEEGFIRPGILNDKF